MPSGIAADRSLILWWWIVQNNAGICKYTALIFYSEMCKIRISSKNNLVHFRHGSQVRIVSLFRHNDPGARRTRPGSEFDNHGISWYTELYEKWNTLRQILVDWLTWHAWIKPIPKWPPCCTTGECFMAKIRIVIKLLFVRASTWHGIHLEFDKFLSKYCLCSRERAHGIASILKLTNFYQNIAFELN